MRVSRVQLALVCMFYRAVLCCVGCERVLCRVVLCACGCCVVCVFARARLGVRAVSVLCPCACVPGVRTM